MFQMPTDVEMDRLEGLLRGSPVLHQVSPMADNALLPMLRQRGYAPTEFTSGGNPEIADQMLDLMQVAAARADGVSFLAELDGEPIATGALAIHDRVAVLAHASTLPLWRHKGAQNALLGTRLQYAAKAGCNLAMMHTMPGSASQRNAERNGFRIAYTRIKFEKH
jgi:GNAT superfamily N-acetyltransferase